MELMKQFKPEQEYVFMADAEVLNRVHDRKIREIMRIAGTPGGAGCDALISQLGRDAEICSSLLLNPGFCPIPSSPITDSGYRSSLTPQESEDEEYFDSLRIPVSSGSENEIISLREALFTIKDELSAVREKAELLSLRLHYKESELEVLKEENSELKQQLSANPVSERTKE